MRIEASNRHHSPQSDPLCAVDLNILGICAVENRSASPPVIAVCGFKNSGKTTLLEGVIPVLCNQGLAVGVIKHDAHGVQVDHQGKDSDRLFRVGADVLLHGPNETLARRHRPRCPRSGYPGPTTLHRLPVFPTSFSSLPGKQSGFPRQRPGSRSVFTQPGVSGGSTELCWWEERAGAWGGPNSSSYTVESHSPSERWRR